MPAQADLIAAALQEIGRARAGQPVPAEDSAVVAPRVGPMLADLAARRITSGPVSADAIPDAFFPDLARLLGEQIGPMFGRKVDADTVKGVEERLRQLSRFDRTQATPLVRAILDQLEQWGVGQANVDATTVAARLPNSLASLATRKIAYFADESDVFDAVQPAVARYIAAWLAPKPLTDVAAQAEMEIRRVMDPGYTYRPARVSYI